MNMQVGTIYCILQRTLYEIIHKKNIFNFSPAAYFIYFMVATYYRLAIVSLSETEADCM